VAKPFSIIEAGSTVQFTWSAASDPSSLTLAVKTASGTTVASVAAVQSGTGAWYAHATITDSFGTYPFYLTHEWTATRSTQAGSASPFLTRVVFEVVKTQAFEQGRTP